MLTILFDGVAYGMLLFILAVGLSVTMGLMNFINLAHGAFAMAGGYLTVVLMQRFQVPFLLCLPLAFTATALLGAVMERTLYRHMYRKPHLDQVLFSIGLAFMSVASMDYFMGSQQQIMQLPDWLRGRTELWDGEVFALGMGHYRLFIIAVCAALTVGLQFVLAKTRFGSRLRASVDDARVAAGLGIRVNLIFAATFAMGSGLAGLGGALGFSAQIHGVFFDCGGRGWHLVDHWALVGRFAAGHCRCGGQVLHAQAGLLHRLFIDDRDFDLASARAVCAQGGPLI
jgi:branched-chain amino acid transport system permease protein